MLGLTFAAMLLGPLVSQFAGHGTRAVAASAGVHGHLRSWRKCSSARWGWSVLEQRLESRGGELDGCSWCSAGRSVCWACWALIWMAWQTLKIPNTQSATGILYVAVIGVFVGELTGLLLSAESAFPL